MAAIDGLVLAADTNVQRVHLETDCQELVNLWEQRKSQKSRIAPLLLQIEVLSQVFLDFKFSFVFRDCNNAAHTCAQLVSRLRPVVEECPGTALLSSWAEVSLNDCLKSHHATS